MQKVILITGAGSGFGELTAKTLAKRGHNVFASMRNVSSKNKDKAHKLTDWAEKNNAKISVIELDVTNEESIQSAVDGILDKAGNIDVVVNNAGVGVLGLQESFTAEDWQRLFDVNVFGVQRVNRAVLPHMREKSSGLLIHISSLLGRMVVPSYGPYNASKWAVEALAENYRVELSAFGVQSCIVEPGGFPTTFVDNLMRPSDSSRNAGYGDFANFPENFLSGFEKAMAANKDQNPQDVADAIANLVDMPAGDRPFRTVVDKMGMGAHIKGYNDSLDQIMSGIYNAFGIGDMLKTRTDKSA